MAETSSGYVTPASLPGLFLVERPVHDDPRGFFHEVERRRADLGSYLATPIQHAQWNHSRSQRGVLRGIHVAQWNKCVYVVRGEAQCVIVDARPESPTFGRHESFLLGESRRAMLFVPAEWYAGGEYGIAWDDPDLAIPWLDRAPLLSDKDQHNPRLRDRFPGKFAP